MSRVEPIRDKAQIKMIADKLLGVGTQRSLRMFVMFEVGIYLGLRIGDMLKLRVGDIRGKSSYEFFPEKTDTHAGIENYKAKRLVLPISDRLENMISRVYKGHADDALLFASRKHPNGQQKAISRQTAWQDMKDIQKMCGLNYRIGCHTLRKTFGYQNYRDGNASVALLMDWFQHSSQEVTMIYIGITDDEKRKFANKINYGELRSNLPSLRM